MGRSNISNYPRTIRGLNAEAETAGHYEKRLSICCGRDSSRKRVTPPSVRFLGRLIYAGAFVALAYAQQPEEAMPSASIEVAPSAPSKPTRKRHRTWWRVELFAAPWFAELAARLSRPVDPRTCPSSLLARFTGSLEMRVVELFKWISLLSTASIPPERSRIVIVR